MSFLIVPITSGKSNEKTIINNASDLCMYLLEDCLVAVVSGDAFGDPNCFRISYAASEETLVRSNA